MHLCFLFRLPIKMWTVAIFTRTNEVAAVPTVWIMSRNCDSETEMCWWPNVKKSNSQLGYKYFNSKQVSTMIKEQYKPNKNEGTYLSATTCTEHFSKYLI